MELLSDESADLAIDTLTGNLDTVLLLLQVTPISLGKAPSGGHELVVLSAALAHVHAARSIPT